MQEKKEIKTKHENIDWRNVDIFDGRTKIGKPVKRIFSPIYYMFLFAGVIIMVGVIHLVRSHYGF